MSKQANNKPLSQEGGAALFRDWLQATGRKATWVVARLETTEQIVSQWRTEKQRPTRAMAKQLEDLSGGAVPAESW